ncbi:MAG: type VI secretion system baseplate subunit TssG [Rhodocyclaceae bacterium]|nr:type VI secretion system baseplate subunit TssG [Rhodocyclaceae bacterium]
METENRVAPGFVSALDDLARSPHGRAFFNALAELMRVRAAARTQPPPPEFSEAVSAEAALGEIAASAQYFDLFAAMRLIECAFPGLPRLGEAKLPNDEPVRLAQEVSLDFPPSPVAALVPGRDHQPPRLVQRVLGLFGPNGALPTHLTEYAFDRLRHEGDAALVRFLDLFHHRMLTLFYRAWAVSAPVVSLDRPGQDRFGNYLAAFCGLGGSAMRQRDSVPDSFKFAHTGIFGRQVKCADGLRQVLANFFHVPVRIEQWVARWLAIPPSEQSRLGRRHGFSMLGEDAVVGERVWDCQSKFRIVLGPLSLDDYRRFLPDAASYTRLRDIVKLYVGMEMDCDVQLILKRAEVPVARLAGSVQLGWVSWLGVSGNGADPDDLILGARN